MCVTDCSHVITNGILIIVVHQRGERTQQVMLPIILVQGRVVNQVGIQSETSEISKEKLPSQACSYEGVRGTYPVTKLMRRLLARLLYEGTCFPEKKIANSSKPNRLHHIRATLATMVANNRK